MPLPMFRYDEELGKKDDEYKPGTRSKVWRQRRLSHIPPRRSIKRIALAVLAVIVLCYIFNKILREEEGDDEMPHSTKELLKPKSPSSQTTSTQPASPSATGPMERDFNGPIKFFDLASTLHAAGRMSGSSPYNQNVLFAAASLKSAAILLPIACEMAIQERNDVHFAFLGRDDISMDLLKSVNGVGKDCRIMFHGEWDIGMAL